MPIIRTQVNCPNCRQPVVADIQQLFDVGTEPQAKQRLLSGAFNSLSCPHCGYRGAVATPLVYHDPAKELLLTYFPPELNIPRNEQEKTIGRLINQVLDTLSQEQRKGYLLNPQAVLTLQGLIERILQEDGVTKEMIEAQQKRISLIQRLAVLSEETLEETAREEDESIDAEFFTLLSRLIQASAAAGDEASAQQLSALQEKLLPITTFGRQLQEQSNELEAAIDTLQEAGEGITREKLLEIVLQAPNETRVSALVSLARSGMDYQFFQLLSEHIEKAEKDEKQRLTELRETLLNLTHEIDQQLEARFQQANQNVEALLKAENVALATQQNLAAIDDFFVQALNAQYEAALKAEDKERQQKLEQIIAVIQQATLPPGAELIQKLIDAPDEESRRKLMEENGEAITPQLVETLTGLLVQLEAGENKEMTEKVRAIYRAAVRMSMQSGMKAG
jgi:hypothetical protein